MTTPPNGHPIWIDLSVTNLELAKQFYGELLGWTFEDRGPDFGHYHIIQKDGEDVGGAMQRSLEMHDGTPDAFAVYFATDNAALTADKAVEAGGRIVVPPMAVGDQGTMLGVIDASGAYVGAWQPGERKGTTAQGIGAPHWYELMTTYYDLALPFYEHTFEFDLVPMGDFRYSTNGPEESATSGICDAAEWFAPGTSFWRVYLHVADVDAAVGAVQALGGALLDGPMESPYGRVATVVDNQGVTFQLITPPAEHVAVTTDEGTVAREDDAAAVDVADADAGAEGAAVEAAKIEADDAAKASDDAPAKPKKPKKPTKPSKPAESNEGKNKGDGKGKGGAKAQDNQGKKKNADKK